MICIGYITTKDLESAQSIGRALVEKKLVACANVLPGVHSVYRWEGAVETAQEALLMIKTTAKQKDRVVSVVKALHSYECPCVVFVDVEGGNPDYLKWVKENSA